MTQNKHTMEIVNKIEIEGKQEVLFDTISDEKKKRIAEIMNERIMNPIGYQRAEACF